jgi:hypothetical protein
MAWEARLGLKLSPHQRLLIGIAGLNGLGSPFGIETSLVIGYSAPDKAWLNGLGSPFGIETIGCFYDNRTRSAAKWPGKPVWD